MNRFFYATLIVLSSLCAYSQTITIGKPYPVIDAKEKIYFAEKGQILAVKIVKKGLILQKMSSTDLVQKKVTTYADFPDDYQIENISKFKSRYYVFYSWYDNEKENLICREIDFANGTFKDKGKLVITVDQKITGSLVKTGFARSAVVDKFDFFFSYDSTSMVVQYRIKPEKRNDSKSFDVIGMHVFDSDLVQKWSNKVTMPYTEKKMDNLDYSVDSKGNVYIVTRVFNDNTTDLKKRGEDQVNYHLEILKIVPNATTTVSTPVDLKDNFVKAIWLYENSKGGMICAGFYSKGITNSSSYRSVGITGMGSSVSASDNIDGMVVIQFSDEGKLSGQQYYEIPLEVLNQYVGDKQARRNERKDVKDKAEYESLVLNSVEVQEDGSMVLLGEKKFVTTHTNTSGGMRSTYVSYHANELLITKVTSDGKLAWMKKIPKQQVSYTGYSNLMYNYFGGAENHYFLFLDNEKNKDLQVNEVPAIHADGSGGFLTIYQVNDKSGTVKRLSILNTRDVKGMELFQLTPSRVMVTGPSTLVVEAYKKGKEDVLVKVTLD